MASGVDLKDVVKHIVDGTLDQNLCRVCLLPLGEAHENIFTKICKEDREFCVADVLTLLNDVEFSEYEHSCVCASCFAMATETYKFFLLSKRSEEILNFYVDELDVNVDSVEQEVATGNNDNFCITLPLVAPATDCFDYSLDGCLTKKTLADEYELSSSESELIVVTEKNDKIRNVYNYKMLDDGTLRLLSEDKATSTWKKRRVKDQRSKARRNRDPMEFQKCSQCPVQYRFISKLKSHMKNEHDIDLFVCKVCKALIENEDEFKRHIKSHTNVHHCNFCNMVFKKRDTIIAHLKWHEEMKNLSNLEGAHVCEVCGFILPNEEELKDHYSKKHDKKYTCYYCGRMYKGEISFETHIKKHEMRMEDSNHMEKNLSGEESAEEEREKKKGEKKRAVCSTCGKHFVDERSLMWHSMLHTNERPYSCDVCGRAFISVNRRNQHVTCAHTMPTKRCPLCPALFHLRSMVNSHIKKVHLKTFRRRNNRTMKHRDVSWRTEVVPIQDLSVSIQNQILELKTN